MPEIKPFTKYICPNGNGQLGHSSLYSGSYDVERLKSDRDGWCICGAEMVEEDSTKDGHRYRLTFDTIDPHQAEQLEYQYGPKIWPTLTDQQWAMLRWHPVSKTADTPGAITEQYRNLVMWERTHEQPIRNVRLERSVTNAWESVDA